MDDTALLQAYIRDGSEVAFSEIVSRHIALVYSAALRQVYEPALAEDISQVVFITLARKAGQLPSGTMLTGWLYRTTRFVTARTVRTERRRRQREQQALEMQIHGAETRWLDVAHYLDDGMAQLGELDRGAVLLRYFKNRSLREVGRALGISEDAAQKRVSRAVEKLRAFFWRKAGLAVPAVTLTSLLSTNGAQLAPPELVAAVIGACSKRAILSTPLYGLLQETLRHPGPRTLWPTLAAPVSFAVALIAAVLLIWQFWPSQRSEAVSWRLDSRIVTHPRPSQAVKPPAQFNVTSLSVPLPAPPAESIRVEVSAPPTNPAATVVGTNDTLSVIGNAKTNIVAAALPLLAGTQTDAKNSGAALGSAAQKPMTPPAPPTPYYPLLSHPNYYVGQGIFFIPNPPDYYTKRPLVMPAPASRLVIPIPPRGRPGPPQKGI